MLKRIFAGRRILAVPAAVIALLAALFATAQVASADPINAPGAFQLSVSCDNGHVYSVVVNGNGSWSPAHDVNGTTTLVPLAFGEQVFTLTDANGNVIDQETIPPSSKGAGTSNGTRATETSCTFSGRQTDPEGNIFTITGSVTGFVTPAKG
jgi:hypothetical protein